MGLLNLASWCILGLISSFPAAEGKAIRHAFNDLQGYEDTLVTLGNEPISALRRLRRAPTPLREIMTDLSRNARQVPEHLRSQEVYERMRSLLALLRMKLGSDADVEIVQFVNWDKTIQIDQVFYTAPINVWQVSSILRAASWLGMRVRATGVGHSRSPLYVDEGNILMDVRQLQRHDGPRMQLNPPTPERNFTTLTALTGVIQKELNEFMTKNGVSTLSQPFNDVETLGGMVSAASHGSTWMGPAYSGLVVELRLVDSAGRLRRFKQEKHPDVINAAKCSLGMFGIMYDITIQVIPTIKVKVENRFVPMSLIYNQTALREMVTSNFLTEISWYPFNSVTDEEARQYQADGVVPPAWNAKRDTLWLRTVNPATEVETQGKEMAPSYYLPSDDSLSGGNLTGLLKGKGALELAQRLDHVSYHYLAQAFAVTLPPRWGTETNSGFFLNIDNQFHSPARAMQWMVERVERQIRQKGTTPLNAFLPRFVLNDDCLLCPANRQIHRPDDSDHSVVLDFLAPPDQDGYNEVAHEFTLNFRNESVRPHWGKRHDNIPGVIPIIKVSYGALLEEFMRMRKETAVDPCDLFTNSYLLEIFGRSESYACPR